MAHADKLVPPPPCRPLSEWIAGSTAEAGVD
jgi:hypothetical protein